MWILGQRHAWLELRGCSRSRMELRLSCSLHGGGGRRCRLYRRFGGDRRPLPCGRWRRPRFSPRWCVAVGGVGGDRQVGRGVKQGRGQEREGEEKGEGRAERQRGEQR